MSGTLTFTMLGLICFCIFAETAREVCFKYAAHDTSIRDALIKPVTWIGVFFWALELASWTAVMEKVPLSIAFPLMALSYAVIVLAGAILFKEHVNSNHALGVFLITSGVVCVGVTGL